ncbi:hypothetical protein ACOZ4N_04890 [Halorientalis pallida]|uniref:hypothetical protein n=1 Tax=Halorientalis pallida TaxID=2479928 RepID=UPI003C6FF408
MDRRNVERWNGMVPLGVTVAVATATDVGTEASEPSVAGIVALVTQSFRHLRRHPLTLAPLAVTAVIYAVVTRMSLPELAWYAVRYLLFGFVMTVGLVSIGHVTDRSAQSRQAILSAVVIGTPLSVVLAVALDTVWVFSLIFGLIAGDVGLIWPVAVVGFVVAVYLAISLSLVVPATLVDQVGPREGLRRGWAAVDSVRWTVLWLSVVLSVASALAQEVATLGVIVAVPSAGPVAFGVARGTVTAGSLLVTTLCLGYLYIDRLRVAGDRIDGD